MRKTEENKTLRARWPRIDVYVSDPQIRQKIKLAAVREDKRMSQWCLEAILGRLAQEENVHPGGSREPDVVSELRMLQEKIKKHRRGKMLADLGDHLEQDRLERIHDLCGLR